MERLSQALQTYDPLMTEVGSSGPLEPNEALEESHGATAAEKNAWLQRVAAEGAPIASAAALVAAVSTAGESPLPVILTFVAAALLVGLESVAGRRRRASHRARAAVLVDDIWPEVLNERGTA